MGKRQHQKDKMYVTYTEWSTLYGGKKAASERGRRSTFKKLPFHCCSLSLQPFQHPLCTPDGIVFDLMNIVPYLKKYGHNPITGEAIDPKSLIKLNYHKNTEDHFHCPVTYKVFNENSHIVAVKTTGHVYSYEAVERLNFKPRNFKDLLTDEPFKRDDVITLQDPAHPEKFDISSFHHVKHSLTVDEEEEEQARKDPMYFLRQLNPETRATLEALSREYKEPEKKVAKSKEKATTTNAAHFSTGAMAASFTSTVGAPVTDNEAAILDRDTLLYTRVKKKGYVRLHTSLGDINLELHCDMVPKTCENFIKLCKKGYYKDTIFHRSIRNFMIQGGDPTATGNGGKSMWGKSFKDEFKPNLTHSGRGVVSMANSGPNTNGSQFFITYRSCRHLDGKHTIFGRLVGGLEVLAEMEKTKTNDQDRPLEEISLNSSTVFVDPFEEAEKQLAEELKKESEEAKEKQETTEKQTATTTTTAAVSREVFRSGVGKYIRPPLSSSSSQSKKKDSQEASSSKLLGKRVTSDHLSRGGGEGGNKKSKAEPAAGTRSGGGGSGVTRVTGFGDFKSW